MKVFMKGSDRDVANVSKTSRSNHEVVTSCYFLTRYLMKDIETALIKATKMGRKDVVVSLLKHEVISSINKALITSIQCNNLSIFKALVDHPACDPRYEHDLALVEACKINNKEMVEILLKNPDVDPSAHGTSLEEDNEPIRWATQNDNYDIMKLLLEHPKKTAFMTAWISDGHPITIVVKENRIATMKRLIEDGHVTVENRRGDWHIILNTIVQHGKMEMCRLVLDCNLGDYQLYDLFERCCYNNRCDILEILLKNPDVDPRYPDFHANPDAGFRMAVKYGRDRVVDMLLKDGRCDPASNDNEAIKSACTNGHFIVVDLLLKDGRSDPSTYDNQLIHDAYCKYRDTDDTGYGYIFMLLLRNDRVFGELDMEDRREYMQEFHKIRKKIQSKKKNRGN